MCSKTIYYDLKIVDGEDITDKVRIDPKYISFDLYIDDGTNTGYLTSV